MSQNEYTYGSQHGNPPPAEDNSYLVWWMNAVAEQERQAREAAEHSPTPPET